MPTKISAAGGKAASAMRPPLCERVHRVDAMMDMIVSDLREAMHVEAVMEIGNDLVAKAIGTRQTYEAHGYNVVHRSLLAHLTLILNRIYDVNVRRPIAKQDKASIPVVLELLKEPEMLAHWQDVARDWNPGMELEDHNFRLVAEKIAASQASWETLQSDAESLEWLASLRRFRNARVAHSLVDYQLGDLPKYGYLRSILLATQPIVSNLRLAMKASDWDYPQSNDAVRQLAGAFWEPFANAMKAAGESEA